MATVDAKERELFSAAFALAYFIHVNKEISFFVAEDALEALSSMLGYQRKNRKPPTALRGIWKWGERTRPVRKTVKLNESQMLQWLVYKESERWERLTEEGQGPYVPTEEDLIVRFIKYLVSTTIKNNSFNVTLAIGSLLHQFHRRETRLFYDILTQSDSARMKDTNYIGKQRLELLERVSKRFEGLVRTVNKSGDEKQFKTRPTTEWTINLVTESLRRFTPWQTSCPIDSKFDVTDIPSLYFAESNLDDEDLIELRRIHTVIEPDCFGRFCEGLAAYVRTLPEKDLDRSCDFGSSRERIVVPQFSNFNAEPPRTDRFQPPELVAEDYIRLQRTLAARARRKKEFVAQRLSIYVDGVEFLTFEPGETASRRFAVSADASLIEMRGKDSFGEITLGLVALQQLNLTPAGFEDTLVHLGGQRITIKMNPIQVSDSEMLFDLDVTYAQASPKFANNIAARKTLTASRKDYDDPFWPPKLTWFAKATALGVTIILASAIGWRMIFHRPGIPTEKVPHLTKNERKEKVEAKTSATNIQSAAEPVRTSRPITLNVARINWSTDPAKALKSIPVELTRAATPTVDVSGREIVTSLSLPVYDNSGNRYTRYRLAISMADQLLWRKTVKAPPVSLTGYANILDFVLFTKRLPQSSAYSLSVTARTTQHWKNLGTVILSRKTPKAQK